MEAAEKVMIACLLLSEGGDDEDVRGFIAAIEEGLERGEKDAVEMRRKLIERMDGPLPQGAAGAIIRLMKAKIEHDAICRRFGVAAGGLAKALCILAQPASGDLAARILVQRAMTAIGDAKFGAVG